jgi:hypothetical protein
MLPVRSGRLAVERTTSNLVPGDSTVVPNMKYPTGPGAGKNILLPDRVPVRIFD